MTFYDISMKMLIANFRRYRLYFLCNMFSVVLFFCFATIFTNESFLDERIVNSSISSNIYAPSILVGIFLVLFIPYSYNAFLKNRKNEYGILIALGMSEKEVIMNMLLENCIIAGASLACGFILGTIISAVFYYILHQVIGISGLHWYFNIAAYLWTGGLYGVTFLLSLVTGIIGFIKIQVTDLMKDRFRSEKVGKSLPGLLLFGVVLIIGSVLIMFISYKNDTSDLRFISMLVMLIGCSIVITKLERLKKNKPAYSKVLNHFLSKIQNTSHNKRHYPSYSERRNSSYRILGRSFVRQHDKSRRRIGLLASWLIGFSVFFMGLCTLSYSSLTANAISYAPYDMVYSQIFGMNQVEDSNIESLLNQNKISVKSMDQLEYSRNMIYNMLPVSEVNEKFNCNYQIAEGKFLIVYQYNLKDGYEHDYLAPASVTFDCKGKTIELKSAGSDIKILFNQNPTFANNTLILNDADYRTIATKCEENWNGIMKLYTFEDWKNSSKGINAVQEYLLKENQVGQEDQNYYKASSKLESYTTSKQSAEFLIFLMSFVVILFCGASNIMIYFKIKSEAEEEQRMLSGLYRIGVTEYEMQKMLQYKNIIYYMPQVIAGVLLGAFSNYAINQLYGYGWKAVEYSLFVGIILMGLQAVIIIRGSRKEFRSFGI